MIASPEPDPLRPPACHLRGCGRVEVHGDGELVVDLFGTGHLHMDIATHDHLDFEGQGLVRYPARGVALLSNARGRIVLRGRRIGLRFSGGPIEAHLRGDFEVRADGTGEVLVGDAPPRRWPLVPAATRRVPGAA